MNTRIFSKAGKTFAIGAVAVLLFGLLISSAYATITSLDLTDPLGGEEWRGTQTVTWTYTDDDNNGGPVSILLSSDSGGDYDKLIANNVDVTLGTYSWDTNNTAAGPLVDGSTYRIKVTDSATALDSSATDFMVDNTAPVTTETPVLGSPDGLNGWYITAPSVTLSCNDGSGSGCLNTYYDWDNVTPITVYSSPVTAPEGEHTLSYFSEDEAVDNTGAHNQESIISTTYKVDTDFPTVAVTSTTVDGYYNEPDTINVTLTFSEEVWSTDILTVSLDSGGSCSVPILTNTTTGTCTYTVGATENSSDLTVTSIVPDSGVVEDVAGNDSTLSPTSNIADTSDIVVDTISPIAFTVGNVTPSGGTVVSGWWNSTNTGVDVLVPIDNDSTLTDGTVQIQVRADSGTYEDVGSPDTIQVAWLGDTPSFSLTEAELEAITGFAEGVTLEFRAVITDIAGNATTGTESTTSLDVDQVVPNVDAGTDKEVNALVSQDATTSDNVPASGLDTHTWSKESGSGTVTFSSGSTADTDLSADTDDTYELRLTVTDVAGNSNSDDMTFVWDTTAPVLAEVTPVTDPTNDNTPSWEFSADHVGWLPGHTGGTIDYGGSCGVGDLTTAVAVNNTTTFGTGTPLADGTYSDCNIDVVDAAGNTSSPLTATSFEVDTIVATVSTITTEDTDPNGKIDKVTIVFDDEIDDSTFIVGDFAIGVISPTAVDTGTTTNDAIVVLTFGTEIDGTEAKTLVYSSSATDLAGNSIAPFSTLSTDLARPMLLSAKTVTTTTIDATFSEDLDGGTVNSSGNEFTVAGYAVSAAVEHVADDGRVVLTVATMPTDATPDVTFTNTGTFTDLIGNEAVTPTTVTAVDEVAPTLTSVTIKSDNDGDTAAPEWAKVGDTATLEFTASEDTATPVVTIDGMTATVSAGPSSWTATYTFVGGETEGVVPFTIDFEDLVSPANVGTQVTAPTDASEVFFDETNPLVDAGADKEVNATVSQDATTSDPSPASEISTWAWTNETPGVGIITFGDDEAEDTTISADTDGTYTLRLTVTDNAGNVAFDEITFIWDTTNPVVITSIPFDGATGVATTASTAAIIFNDAGNIILIDSSRVTLVNDTTEVSYIGAVAVSGGDGNSKTLNVDYSVLEYDTVYRINVLPGAVKDVAGNNLTTNFIAYFNTGGIPDTTPPDAPVITTATVIIDADTYTIAGTVADDGGTRVVNLYNGATPAGTAVVSTGQTDWSILTTLTQDADNVFTAEATDGVGNVSSASVSVTITEATPADTTVPVITLLGENPLTLTEGDVYTDPGATAADDRDGDLGSVTGVSTVDENTAGTYTVTYNISDAAGNPAVEEVRTVIVEAAFDDTASLAVTAINIVANANGSVGYATANDDFDDGWSWTYYITVPTSEMQFSMKFDDFVSGGDTILAADNIRLYSAQASANSASTTAVTILNAGDPYSTAITLDDDLESGTPGRQIEVTVEMKVPMGSAGGSYSAQYGVKSE